MILHLHFLHLSHILAHCSPWHTMHISLFACVIHRKYSSTYSCSIYKIPVELHLQTIKYYCIPKISITAAPAMYSISTILINMVEKPNAFQCQGQTIKCPVRCPVLSSILLLFFNPLNTELNPIYLLALLAHHFLHVSRIRVKSLTIRLLMSYIYGAPILDVSRSHTTTQHSR